MSEAPSAEIITFKLPANQKAQLEEIAAKDERTVSWVLRQLVREFLEDRAKAAA